MPNMQMTNKAAKRSAFGAYCEVARWLIALANRCEVKQARWNLPWHIASRQLQRTLD